MKLNKKSSKSKEFVIKAQITQEVEGKLGVKLIKDIRISTRSAICLAKNLTPQTGAQGVNRVYVKRP